MANYSIILSCIAVLAHTFPLASAHLIPSPIVFDQLIYNQENLDLDDDILSNPVPVIFLYSAENTRESQDDVVSAILAAAEREELAEEYAAEEEAEAAVLHRSRRQIRVPPSFDLSSSHNDKYGAPRPVGKVMHAQTHIRIHTHIYTHTYTHYHTYRHSYTPTQINTRTCVENSFSATTQDIVYRKDIALC